MTTQTAPSEISSLGYYIKDTLFNAWKKERADIELEMQTNLDAFNAVITGDFWKQGETEDWRSDTFVQLTKMKVLAAYSMVIDILLQGGKIPFTLKPSPWDMVVFEDLPIEQRQQIENDMDDMKRLIQQQLVDCCADRQLMKCVMSGAIYGETYAKYFVHEVERSGFQKILLAPSGMNDAMQQFTRWEPYRKLVTSPAFEYVSNWSIYRDLETEDLQEGQGVIQRGMMSPYELRQKIGSPYWIDDAIVRAIAEADQPSQTQGSKDTKTLPPGLRNIQHRFKTMESLEFWGRAPRLVVEQFEDLIHSESTEAQTALQTFDFMEFEHDGDEIEVMALMADDEVVRYSRNKPNSRPYYRVVWEIALDETSGTGVAKNVRGPQKVINGAVRAFEDNKKLSANIMAVIKRQFLPNFDGVFTPGKEIEISDECDDARKAFQQLIIQDVGQTLLDLIGINERYADEASQLPKIMQGATHEKQKPDTLGEMNILQANAGKYLGGVIKNYDEGLIEPSTTDFYKYNMADPDVKKGKGNFIAKPLGFTSFQNQVVRLHKLMQGLNLVMSSEELKEETKIREILEEIWKAFDIDTAQVMKTPEEKTAEAEQRAQIQAEAEAKARQAIREDMAMEEEAKQRDHERKIKEIEAKGKADLDKIEEKFEGDLVLKKMDENKPEKPAEKKAA